MDDPLGVGRVQRVCELNAQLQNLLGFEGLPCDAVLECLALHEFHGDEGLTLVLVDVVDGADMGVVEGGAGPGLAPEPLQGHRVAEEFLRQELQRDGAVQAGVLGLVDDTHASAADLLQDAVVGDGLTDHVVQPAPESAGPGDVIRMWSLGAMVHLAWRRPSFVYA